jgi:parallel beta-helix repeat protein
MVSEVSILIKLWGETVLKKIVIILLIGCLVLSGIIIFPLDTDAENGDKITQNKNNQSREKRNTLYVGTGQTYSKIQDAVDAASSGDTIRVYAGTYYENVMINKTLSLIGNGSLDTIINGSKNGNVVTINADRCNISGFNVTNSGPWKPWPWVAGIFVNSNYNNITNTDCNYNNWNGISINSSNGNYISNCTFKNNYRDGINLSSSDKNTILNCTFLSNEDGLDFLISDNNWIENNNFSHNSVGIDFGTFSSLNTVIYNSFVKNKYVGITVWDASGPHTIYNNNFINNNNGGNQGGASSWSGNWNGPSTGNHWSDWTTPDNNSDGIVDNPYIISGSAGVKDLYPLVKPVSKSSPPSKSNGSIFIVRTGQGFSKIQDAINSSISGDTIRVYAGIYYEKIIINKKLNLIGNGSSYSTIDSNSWKYQEVIRIGADNCSIKGFNILGNGTGILSLSNGNIIEDCKCSDTGDYGLFLSESDHNIISNFSSDSNLYGMTLADSHYNRISNVNLSASTSGPGIAIWGSTNNIVVNSTFQNNNWVGLAISSSQNKIMNNRVIDNKKEQIFLYPGSKNNKIYNNNFIHKSGYNNVSDDGVNNNWNISGTGNYWSNWTSPDNNNDGIVDKPYEISGNAGAKDYYPLVEPYDGKIEKPQQSNGTVIIVRTGQRFSKIQDAIDNASTGDTIRVYDGIYYENVVVNKKLNIIGNGTSKTIINGSYVTAVVYLNADNCNLSGLQLTGSGIGGYGQLIPAGLLIESDYNIISNCVANKNSYGFFLGYADNNKIENVSGISNSWHGINLSFSDNNQIIASSFSGNQIGIALGESDQNTIKNNICYENEMYGIDLDVGSKRNTVRFNILRKNGNVGIILRVFSNYNSIFYNDLINNNNGGTQASDFCTGTMWNTSTHGNYWSDWTSPDNNFDGIVDKPYNISGNAGMKDYYPLVEPFKIFDYPPEIVSENINLAFVDQLYSVKYLATDYDTPPNNLTWSMKTNASWLSFFANNQTLYGIPSSSDVGTYWVSVSVSDRNSSDSTNFTLTVIDVTPPPKPVPKGNVIIVRTGQKFSKIQNAIDNASSEDTIRIWAGSYKEKINVNKKLTLIGNSSSNTIINGFIIGPVLTLNADGCSISNINITHDRYKGNSCEGIQIYSNFNEIKDCILFKNNKGIVINSSSNNIIKNCIIESNFGSGISISSWFYTNSENNTVIYNNIIKNGNVGITIDYYTKNNLIHHNNIINNIWNLQFFKCQAADDGTNNIWNTKTEGNYWSEWTSPDNNSDGIVDKPYLIKGNAEVKDLYPLTTKVKITQPKTHLPPIITTNNLNKAYVGYKYSVNYTAADPDTSLNKLTWAMKTNASWLTFSNTQELYGTPSRSDKGSFWINISVSDGENSDNTYFILTVLAKKPPKQLYYPEVENTSIKQNSINVSVNTSEIIIIFTESMDRTSVENALNIWPPIDYSLVWEKNDTVLKIVFNEDMASNTTYSITIGTLAKDKNGNNLISELKLTFTTETVADIDDDDKPKQDDRWSEFAVIASIIFVIIVIIFLITLAFITRNRNLRQKESGPDKSRQEADDKEIIVKDGLEEIIYELKNTALKHNKPSESGPDKKEILNKVEQKYRNGQISKSTYQMIKNKFNKQYK